MMDDMIPQYLHSSPQTKRHGE